MSDGVPDPTQFTDPQRAALGLPPDVTEIKDPATGEVLLTIRWQTGVMSAGRNGVTLEDLLAACSERLQAFNKTKFYCRENSAAITKIQEAEHWLLHRTRDRQARGVEGTLDI